MAINPCNKAAAINSWGGATIKPTSSLRAVYSNNFPANCRLYKSFVASTLSTAAKPGRLTREQNA
ncbi:hypothetical protein DPMN_180668 [Dreissena polymorpha]|uniref:Uncharacterized protein n=1 Tax=Dreissena polymorpha TaxID=45954 RepID=A0A9D4EDJ3_DREPO|nr:hypothetical protein DPMN_177578 [Dreissena polymorpha]KAH3779187.1 hypothetical protein DPMN_180668 [Dreissena polymorpha]